MQELPISLPTASSESLGQETRLFWRAEAAAGAPVGSVPELPTRLLSGSSSAAPGSGSCFMPGKASTPSTRFLG